MKKRRGRPNVFLKSVKQEVERLMALDPKPIPVNREKYDAYWQERGRLNRDRCDTEDQ